MKTILFLDDDKERHATAAAFKGCHVFHAFDKEQFEGALSQNPDIVFLDHDLFCFTPDGEWTGRDAARAIVDSNYTPFVVIHSWNPIGAEEIKKILTAGNIACIISPFNYEQW